MRNGRKARAEVLYNGLRRTRILFIYARGRRKTKTIRKNKRNT